MIVIGDDHTFTDFELNLLDRKYKNIYFVLGRLANLDDIKQKLEPLIIKDSKQMPIVLNIYGPASSVLLAYLTKIEQRDGVRFLTVETFLEHELKKMFIPKKLTNLRFLEKVVPYSKLEYLCKRLIDIFGAFFLLIFSSPIMLYAVYRIKKESPNGSVLFKQKRVGYCGKEFVCIKFRSMNVDAEKNGAQFASRKDPRVFSWGETMRKTRVDELPQLINVLKGEMHLVGPRPERKIWVEQFEKVIPYYNERHLVRPGITGWAQVMYPYGANEEDARQKLMFDLYYIKKWSLVLEAKTLLRTIVVVLGKRGI